VGLLEARGHTVAVAFNGKEAVAAVARDEFDAVLMDVQMPEMDGLEAAAAIRRAEKATGRHIPIIAMTAHAMKGDRERCLEAGMDDYISKPIQSEVLYEVLERVAAAHRSTGATETDCEQWVDLTAALRRVRGRKEALEKLVRLFLKESVELQSAIRQALADADAPRLEKAAHTLRGSLECFGARPAAEAALQLELKGRQRDLTAASESSVALETEIERVRTVLAAYAKAEVGEV
jgi:two-component system sensor histidine kinase/response regulator